MKKPMIVLAFSLLAIAATAQDQGLHPTQRGNFVIGSRIGFSTSKSSIDVQSTSGTVKGDGGSSSQFNLSPGIGYFFARDFVMGISMDWLQTNSSSGVDINGGTTAVRNSENTNILFGPFLRYFIPFGEDKSFFLGSSIGFGNSKNQFVDNDLVQTIDNSILSIGVGPGLTIFSSNGLALEALAKYNFARSDSEINIQGITRVSKTWTNAVDFSVGLQYYFGGFKSVNENRLAPESKKPGFY